jgi:AAA15 family ATPase/GTPase
LLPALYRLRTSSAVYFIDEISRSMHPMLVSKFIEFFLKACTGGQRQIIVTTHESNLLNLELLRRDEIWFAEKDGHGATHLYSLTEFQVRKDLQIRKGYLEGRFGAVPFLGALDNLIEESVAAR